MHLDDYANQVQQQLAAAAALGDEQVQRVAYTLSEAATSAVRLAILGAVSEAADEITALLLDFPLSPNVSVRLVGDELRTEVDASVHAAPEPAPVDDGEASARISLRLTEALKTQLEQAAGRDGVSVNTWIVRALNNAVADGGRRTAPTTFTVGNPHRITGYING
jgi:hypothetical protein